MVLVQSLTVLLVTVVLAEIRDFQLVLGRQTKVGITFVWWPRTNFWIKTKPAAD